MAASRGGVEGQLLVTAPDVGLGDNADAGNLAVANRCIQVHVVREWVGDRQFKRSRIKNHRPVSVLEGLCINGETVQRIAVVPVGKDRKNNTAL